MDNGMNIKKSGIIAVILTLTVLSLGCSGNRDAIETNLGELFSNPSYYNEKNVTIEGYFFSGWETITLSESMKHPVYAPEHFIPDGRMMWVDGGIPKDIYDRLNQQQMMGPLERYGKVRATGKFQYGGKYGHLGGYDSQIAPSKIELLGWTPPK
jgi:hypothetical protein